MPKHLGAALCNVFDSLAFRATLCSDRVYDSAHEKGSAQQLPDSPGGHVTLRTSPGPVPLGTDVVCSYRRDLPEAPIPKPIPTARPFGDVVSILGTREEKVFLT
jgi:hypothetical protein